MISLEPVTLEGHGVRLEPLQPLHETALRRAEADGHLSALWYAAVPEPHHVKAYIDEALEAERCESALPWIVRELSSGEVVGTTRYHDVEATIDRIHIGYTWYAQRWQRTHVNTACKLLLLTHAFEAIGARDLI